MENRRMENPKELVKKSRATWWEDGLTEIVSGKGLILVAFSGIMKDIASGNAKIFWTLLFILSLLGIAIRGQWLIRWLKKQLVWPFTGYAVPHKERWSLKTSLLIIIIVSLFFSILVLKLEGIVALLTGLFAFLIYSGIGQFSGLHRFYYEGAIGLLSGILLSILGVPSPLSIYSVLGIVGIVSTLSGVIVYLKFRKGLKVSYE